MPSNEEFQEEFSITSNIRSFTVRAASIDERNDWLEAVNSAIEEQQNRQSSFNHTDDGVPPTPRTVLSPEDSLGEVAPVWIPDQRVAHCQVNQEYKLKIIPNFRGATPSSSSPCAATTAVAVGASCAAGALRTRPPSSTSSLTEFGFATPALKSLK